MSGNETKPQSFMFWINTAKVRLNSCYFFKKKHEAKFWSSCAGGLVNFDQSVTKVTVLESVTCRLLEDI